MYCENNGLISFPQRPSRRLGSGLLAYHKIVSKSDSYRSKDVSLCATTAINKKALRRNGMPFIFSCDCYVFIKMENSLPIRLTDFS